jgi:periplasmic mercuric ion binding protein
MARYVAALSILTVALGSLGGSAVGAESTATTTIRVKDMHCEACATKIRRGLFTVAGVVNVKTDLKAHLAVVVPQQSRQPSPRALWEAVEKAGFQVMQLDGPSGTFTDKPRQ